MNKKGQITLVHLALIFIALYAFVPAVQDGVNGIFSKDGSGVPTGQGGVCAPGVVIEDTTVTLASNDIYAPSTAVGTNYYWLNGVRKGYLASGGTFQASPGDEVKVLFAENSTTHLGLLKEYTVGCSGTFDIQEDVFPMSTSEDWTVVVVNSDGTSNTLSNQTIGAGDIKTIKLELESAWKTAIGSPDSNEKNVLSCRYNVSAYDKLDLTSGGSTLPTVSSPVFLPTQTLTNVQWKSWAIDQLWSGPNARDGLATSSKFVGELRIDADDAANPDGTAGSFASNGDIECRLDDTDFDLHATSFDILEGVADEDNNNLGVSSIVYNFTVEVN